MRLVHGAPYTPLLDDDEVLLDDDELGVFEVATVGLLVEIRDELRKLNARVDDVHGLAVTAHETVLPHLPPPPRASRADGRQGQGIEARPSARTLKPCQAIPPTPSETPPPAPSAPCPTPAR
jgi:hypothetical protein